VFRSSAPNAVERGFPYLWRYWRDVPRDGEIAIFDRSWYGRVLVERVEGFADAEAWRRAYAEIRDFEDQLVAHGIIVAKFWLQIDPDVQLERFEARETTPFKMYKLTDEDYRNRNRWKEYADAANEMILRTHRPDAPWHVISANDKRWARIEILETLARRFADSLHGRS